MHHQHYASHEYHSQCSYLMPSLLDHASWSEAWLPQCSEEAAVHPTNAPSFETSNLNHSNLLSLDIVSVIEEAFSCGLYPSSSPGVQLSSAGSIPSCLASAVHAPLESLISGISVPTPLLPCTSEFIPDSTWTPPALTVTEPDNSALHGGDISTTSSFPVIDISTKSDNNLLNHLHLWRDRRNSTSNLNRRAKRKAKPGELYACGSMKRLAKTQPYDGMVKKFRIKK